MTLWVKTHDSLTATAVNNRKRKKVILQERKAVLSFEMALFYSIYQHNRQEYIDKNDSFLNET